MVRVIFTFYIKSALKLKCLSSVVKGYIFFDGVYMGSETESFTLYERHSLGMSGLQGHRKKGVPVVDICCATRDVHTKIY